MGTRNLILVYYKGQYVIAQYCQWDGYPSGQGVVILAFARNPEKLTKLKNVIDADLLYEPDETQLEAWKSEADSLKNEYDERLRKSTFLESHNNPELWRHPMEMVCPTMSRETGARILELAADATAPFPVVKSMSWTDDLEWAYVLDLDEGLLEVYGGDYWDIVDRPQSDRFEGDDCAIENWPEDICIGKWSLDALSDKDEFVKTCDPPKKDTAEGE